MLEAAYATTSIATNEVNLYSAYLVADLICVALFVDAQRDRSPDAKRIKYTLLVLTAVFVSVYLNFIRGHRASAISLLSGYGALYLTETVGSGDGGRTFRKRLMQLALIAVGLVPPLILVGGLRSSVFDVSLDQIDIGQALERGQQHATWTCILLTNLGNSAMACNQGPSYMWGQTYIDYVLSLPPGFITSIIGYERPLEANHNPGWWFSFVAVGGVHPVIVPYRNFGAAGALIIMGIIGFAIGTCDRRSQSPRFWGRFIFSSVVTSSFMWFWYGDMNIIRGIMIAVIINAVYKGALMIGF
jgi:hypothetical protein